jgi:predicted RNase H-related nuclease YkuK (DUF458 family)
MVFVSPTKGIMDMTGIVAEIFDYMNEEPLCSYRIIIGSDSQAREAIRFVTAVVLHREGKGGRYFYSTETMRFAKNLRQRIFLETSRSLVVADAISRALKEKGLDHLNLEIHLDVGENGATRDLVREVVGMVTGSGFGAKIKPFSYGASTVADKYTK